MICLSHRTCLPNLIFDLLTLSLLNMCKVTGSCPDLVSLMKARVTNGEYGVGMDGEALDKKTQLLESHTVQVQAEET